MKRINVIFVLICVILLPQSVLAKSDSDDSIYTIKSVKVVASSQNAIRAKVLVYNTTKRKSWKILLQRLNIIENIELENIDKAILENLISTIEVEREVVTSQSFTMTSNIYFNGESVLKVLNDNNVEISSDNINTFLVVPILNKEETEKINFGNFLLSGKWRDTLYSIQMQSVPAAFKIPIEYDYKIMDYIQKLENKKLKNIILKRYGVKEILFLRLHPSLDDDITEESLINMSEEREETVNGFYVWYSIADGLKKIKHTLPFPENNFGILNAFEVILNRVLLESNEILNNVVAEEIVQKSEYTLYVMTQGIEELQVVKKMLSSYKGILQYRLRGIQAGLIEFSVQSNQTIDRITDYLKNNGYSLTTEKNTLYLERL